MHSSALLQSLLCASPRSPSQTQLTSPEEKATLFSSLLLKNTDNFTVDYFYSAFFYFFLKKSAYFVLNYLSCPDLK